MVRSWRYDTTVPDYEALRRELLVEPFLRMRDDETYYFYMRRMDMLVERASEVRDGAWDMWVGARVDRERVLKDSRDISSTSIRPPTGVTTPTYAYPYHQPNHYTLDPQRSPYRYHPYRPVAPERLGVLLRGSSGAIKGRCQEQDVEFSVEAPIVSVRSRAEEGSQETRSSEVVVWEPGSPVVEVVVISSAGEQRADAEGT